MGLATDIAEGKTAGAGGQSASDIYNEAYNLDYGFGNTAMSGLTFGGWDEIRGFSDMLISKLQGGDLTYEQARDAMRRKLSDYQEANKGLAISAEILGAAAPTALALLIPGGQGISAANLGRMAGGTHSLGQVARRAVPVGMVEGGAQAYLEGTDGAWADLARIPGGATVGGLTAGVMSSAAPKVTDVAGDFFNYLRKKFEGKPTGVVEAEIQKLIKLGYGDNPSDVINGLLDGRIMADNPILAATLREYRSRGAKLPDAEGARTVDISQATKERAATTRAAAGEAVQQRLTPTMEGNVLKQVNRSVDQLKADARSDYDRIFKEFPEDAGRDVVAAMTQAMNRFPQLAEGLEEGLRAKGQGGLVPFARKAEDGTWEIYRQPTIKEAELLRRTVEGWKQDAFMGKGMGSEFVDDLVDVERVLRGAIDTQSGVMQQARSKWARVMDNKRAFDLGKKAWNRNVEEQEAILSNLMEKNDVMGIQYFRAGAMSTFRDKAKTSPGLYGKLLDENTPEGNMLLRMFPGEDLSEILRKSGIAEDARQVRNIVDPTRQSITADQLAARENVGKSDLGVFDIAGAARLDPQSIARVGEGVKSLFNVDLTPAQLNKVVDVMFQDDPEVIKKILQGGGWTETQFKRMGMIVDAALRGGISYSSRQAGSTGGDASQKLITDF